MPQNPQLPTPSTSASGRSRRYEQQSEEVVSSRGPFGILVGFQRVGTPKLRPLPLVNLHHGSVLSKLLRQHSITMQLAVKDILVRNGLPASAYEDDPEGFDIEFTDRCEPHDLQGTRQPTLYVIAPWTEEATNKWYNATKQLKIWVDHFLDLHGMEDVDLSIEIISTQRVEKKYTTVVPHRDDWLAGWSRIRREVEALLQSFESSRNKWTCVALVKFGPNEVVEFNPPTVYVGLDQACDEGLMAKAVRPAIQAHLDKTPFGWHLHIEYDIPDSGYTFELLALNNRYEQLQIHEDYQTKINLGGNIGASNFVHSVDANAKRNSIVGTLGCYVELNYRGKWLLFGLTNYHVIRHALPGAIIDSANLHAPATNSILYRADHEGFRPGNVRNAQVECPSRTSHNATLAWHDQQIAKELRSLPEDIKARDRKIRFFDEGKHPMGYAWAGSGFARRTRGNGMLDWALIKVKDERVGRNVLPDVDAWPEDFPAAHVPSTKIRGKELSTVIPQGQSLVSESLAFKYGVATKGRTARCNEYLAGVLTKERLYMANEDPTRYGSTVEQMFISVQEGDEARFAARGDSGSIVYDEEGQALGLLFTGNDRHLWTYVTPLQDVFQDIKAFSEGSVTEIRLAVLAP